MAQENAIAARYRGYIVFCSVLALIVGGVIGYLTPRPGVVRSPMPRPIVVSTPLPTPTPLPTATPAPIRVYVSGAVHRPAVYTLPPGSIVQDALEAAGGATSEADLDCINLAQEVHDQQQVYVPRRGEASPPAAGVSGGRSTRGTTGAKININTATAAELETLPRIGPTMAQRIVEYREASGPFKTIEDIQNVPGIGPTTFAAIKDLITVGP